MTVYNELNKIAYIGDTAQTLYPIPFEYISTEDIKVSIYTSGNEFVEDWMYSTQYVIEDENIKILSGYEIDNTKKLLVLRKVDLVQDNKYREGGDFPAKSTETSFDKLTMITQQLQETLDRCVKVEVLDIQSPDELLAEVYSKLDSATDVAQDAIAAANEATIAAEQATTAVEEAKKQVIETQEYVDSAKIDISNTKDSAIQTITATVTTAVSEINNTVSTGKQEINTTIDEAQMNLSDTIEQAVDDVKAEAIAAAEGAIQDAANTAIQIATDHANTVIKPELQTYVDSSNANATVASNSANAAMEYANSASTSATNASASATRSESAATRAETAAAQSEQASGKIVQLGFDGAIEDGVLVFTHSPSGVEVPYELLDDYEYEVDMLYNSTEELSADTQMYVKNGADTITFVSALHRSSEEYVTVGDMQPVARYNTDTGYRWLFKAAYKITPAGKKVFLLYPVAAQSVSITYWDE